MKMENLEDTLREIARQRVWTGQVSDQLSDDEEVLHKTPQWNTYKRQREALEAEKEYLSQLESATREAMAEYAEETGEKKPIKGLSAVSTKNVIILNEKKAKAWVSENAPDILTINKSKLKKAVVNLSLDFIKITETFSGRIASDLSEYLVDTNQTLTEDEQE